MCGSYILPILKILPKSRDDFQSCVLTTCLFQVTAIPRVLGRDCMQV